MENTEVKEQNSRVRMNVSVTAKGLAQWDCTVEFDSVEKSSQELFNAIGTIRKVIAQCGLTEVGGVEK